jgi:hypothetical protein
VSSRFIKKGFQLKRPKPRAKDPLVELKKQLRREEIERKLVERLGETEITGKVIHSNGTAFSPLSSMDGM